jgi:D-alanyl-D-alanine carboxypeptidase
VTLRGDVLAPRAIFRIHHRGRGGRRVVGSRFLPSADVSVKALPDLDSILHVGIPGVVVVARSPASSSETAAGLADLSSGAPMTLDHRFRIASVTKLFVASVVLQLVDEGALSLDSEVASIEGGVTVRQLLNHTSGLPHIAEMDELLEPYRQNPAYRPDLTPFDVLARIERKPRLFSPGEGWFYSGSNYVVLGLLIEESTGATLNEQLHRRIFQPLGLTNTELPDLSATPTGLARGYLPADNPALPGPGPDPVDVTDVEPFGWGGSGMVSTARDLARFLRALLGGELLPPALRAEMLSTVPSDWEESDGYGLGIEEVTSLWGLEKSTCGPAWGHFGFSLGFTTIALASETGDRQVVVMFNTHPLSEEVWSAVGRLTWVCYCRLQV